MGTGGEELLARRVSEGFAPLLCFLEVADLLIEIVVVADGDLSHIV